MLKVEHVGNAEMELNQRVRVVKIFRNSFTGAIPYHQAFDLGFLYDLGASLKLLSSQDSNVQEGQKSPHHLVSKLSNTLPTHTHVFGEALALLS